MAPNVDDPTLTIPEAALRGLRWSDLQRSAWQRLDRGIYASSALPAEPRLHLRAALRRSPPDAVFSGRSAAWLHGLDCDRCSPIEVTLPRRSTATLRPGMRLHREDLQAVETAALQDLPATSVLKTLYDVGRWLPRVEAVCVLEDAVRHGRVTQGQLVGEAVRRAGTHGVTRFRAAAGLVEPASESPMETELRLLLVDAGLPRPLVQVPLYDRNREFLGRVDLYYEQSRLAIEYDGGHRRRRLSEDNQRQNRLLLAGYRLLRFAAYEVKQTPGTVVTAVRDQLSRG